MQSSHRRTRDYTFSSFPSLIPRTATPPNFTEFSLQLLNTLSHWGGSNGDSHPTNFIEFSVQLFNRLSHWGGSNGDSRPTNFIQFSVQLFNLLSHWGGSDGDSRPRNFIEFSRQLFNTLSQSGGSNGCSSPTYTYQEPTDFLDSDEPSPSAFHSGNARVQNEQPVSGPVEDGDGERLLTIGRELEARMWVYGDDDGDDHTTIDEDDRQVCAICLDELSTKVEITRLDCRHKYHLDCIKNWLIKKNFCPLCKRKAIQ